MLSTPLRDELVTSERSALVNVPSIPLFFTKEATQLTNSLRSTPEFDTELIIPSYISFI